MLFRNIQNGSFPHWIIGFLFEFLADLILSKTNAWICNPKLWINLLETLINYFFTFSVLFIFGGPIDHPLPQMQYRNKNLCASWQAEHSLTSEQVKVTNEHFVGVKVLDSDWMAKAEAEKPL